MRMIVKMGLWGYLIGEGEAGNIGGKGSEDGWGLEWWGWLDR